MDRKKERGALHLILGFADRITGDHVAAYAAQTAYFLMMSFIPFVLFLAAIVQYTPLTYGMVRQVIISIVPENLQGFVLGIVAEVFSKNAAVLSVSALVALWSSGKGMQALINGLNTICKRNAKLAGKQDLFHAVHVSVCYSADHQPSASGNGKQDP